MGGVQPKNVIALAAVTVFAVVYILGNPHKKLSSSGFWASATVVDVADVPQEALEPGNRHGPVVMWAAMSTDIPEIVRALVERGANINETDGIFEGTPLSAVAAHGEHPQMLDTLVELGVDVRIILIVLVTRTFQGQDTELVSRHPGAQALDRAHRK